MFSCGGLQFKYRLIGEVSYGVMVSFSLFFLRYVFTDMPRILVMLIQSLFRILGNIAGNICKHMRREEAAIKIQKNLRRQVAKKEYGQTKSSAVTLQSGVRTMVARHEFRFKLKSKAATVIQVLFSLLCLHT